VLEAHFEIGARVADAVACLFGRSGVDAAGAHGVGQPHPVDVDEAVDPFTIEAAGDGAAAEQAAAEARAFLIRPVDELHSDGRRALRCEPAQHLEPADDAEAAVEPAAVGDAVEVAAHDERVRGCPGERGPDVAGLICFYRDGQLCQA